MQELVKVELLERYGSDLSDTELRDAARADMLEQMEAQLASEVIDVKGVTNATATVDRDGEGRTAAAKEFAKLLSPVLPEDARNNRLADALEPPCLPII